MEEVTKTIDGKEVLFEAIEMVENHGHSREWSMEGFTQIEGEFKHTHNAIGSYDFTGEFEELTDIEKVGC
jgi:hypothetical protein